MLLYARYILCCSHFENIIMLHIVILILLIILNYVVLIRCSPRVPDYARKAMINQGASHAKKPKEMADSVSTPLGGGNYVSMHQGGNLCKDRAVHNLTYTSEAPNGWSYPIPGFSRSDSSSLFSNSDAGSSSTHSSNSTNSTRNLTSIEYDYLFGASDHMHPGSPAVIPEEDELSYLRQRSSFNPCSSSHYTDQGGGEFAQQYYHRLQVRGRVLEEGGEKPSFYTDQGKQQGSSGNRNRSFSRSCKITEQRRYTGKGMAFFLEGRGLSKHFTGRGGLGL
jgi:ubiquitin carboxyl-terminal hydrolase 36/42